MSEIKVPVKVALRIRPLNRKEEEEDVSSKECLQVTRTDVSDEQQVTLGKNKAFTYDYVFRQKSSQVEIYRKSVQSLLKALFKGYNASRLRTDWLR